jgi:hypothetical protein
MLSARQPLLLGIPVLALFLCLAQPGRSLAQGLAEVKANYTKY